MGVLLGDGRRLFANHFFVKADVYFHSGYYPSVFDAAAQPPTQHIAEDAGAARATDEPGHAAGAKEEDEDYLGPPKDWIDRFSRHFYPSRHTHLDQPGEAREILPWLRIAADLDPQRVETYTVAAFWLRSRLGKVDQAEQLLREGWRANPDSYEILFELGRVFLENRHDPARARNVWELALRKWQAQEGAKSKPNEFAREQIAGHLAVLEEREGHPERAIDYLEIVKRSSPNPAAVQKQIDDLKAAIHATRP